MSSFSSHTRTIYTNNDERLPKSIYKLLKYQFTTIDISTRAMKIVNCLIAYIFQEILSNNQKALTKNRIRNLSTYDLQNAVRMTLPLELTKKCVSKATKSVSLSNCNEKTSLLFSTHTISEMFEMSKFSQHFYLERESVVYLTAVLEQITIEIFEIAQTNLSENNKNRISPHVLKTVVKQNEELNLLFGGLTIETNKHDKEE